jgi:hypothetical protein
MVVSRVLPVLAVLCLSYFAASCGSGPSTQSLASSGAGRDGLTNAATRQIEAVKQWSAECLKESAATTYGVCPSDVKRSFVDPRVIKFCSHMRPHAIPEGMRVTVFTGSRTTPAGFVCEWGSYAGKRAWKSLYASLAVRVPANPSKRFTYGCSALDELSPVCTVHTDGSAVDELHRSGSAASDTVTWSEGASTPFATALAKVNLGVGGQSQARNATQDLYQRVASLVSLPIPGMS